MPPGSYFGLTRSGLCSDKWDDIVNLTNFGVIGLTSQFISLYWLMQTAKKALHIHMHYMTQRHIDL